MFWNVNVKVFIIVEFVYVQVNEIPEYVQDILNITMVVIIKVLLPYEFIYEMGLPMSEKQVKKLQSCVVPPLSAQVGAGA